jgi:hypothetical protein
MGPPSGRRPSVASGCTGVGPAAGSLGGSRYESQARFGPAVPRQARIAGREEHWPWSFEWSSASIPILTLGAVMHSPTRRGDLRLDARRSSVSSTVPGRTAVPAARRSGQTHSRVDARDDREVDVPDGDFLERPHAR